MEIPNKATKITAKFGDFLTDACFFESIAVTNSEGFGASAKGDETSECLENYILNYEQCALEKANEFFSLLSRGADCWDDAFSSSTNFEFYFFQGKKQMVFKFSPTLESTCIEGDVSALIGLQFLGEQTIAVVSRCYDGNGFGYGADSFGLSSMIQSLFYRLQFKFLVTATKEASSFLARSDEYLFIAWALQWAIARDYRLRKEAKLSPLVCFNNIKNLDTLKVCSFFKGKEYIDYVVSVAGAKSQKEIRWNKLSEIYGEACVEAWNLWKKGDTRWHYQMAADLLDRYNRRILKKITNELKLKYPGKSSKKDRDAFDKEMEKRKKNELLAKATMLRYIRTVSKSFNKFYNPGGLGGKGLDDDDQPLDVMTFEN